MRLIAALPMYDWPEIAADTDRQWAQMRHRLMAAGIDAPAGLVRRNADMPAVNGGIRDVAGRLIAPDPASLPPEGLDLATLWRHPALLLGQTCWGPMECGLASHVRVTGRPDYSSFPGGRNTCYRSALVMRRSEAGAAAAPPLSAKAALPPLRRRMRFAFNDTESLSGYIGLRRDMTAAGLIACEAEFDSFWDECIATGSHRRSVRSIARGESDLAAIDCRSLELCRRFESDAMGELAIVGWTRLRPGPPFIAAAGLARALELAV